MNKKLISLSSRCEAATGPDRELDLRIEAAINPEYDSMDEEHARFLTKYGGHPRYTASLDAAMTLVPDGYEYAVGTFGNPDTEGPWAWCATQAQSAECEFDYSRGRTPTLALCAAALRAQATTQEEGR